MNTEQTAQQLELAAQILRTGHPWEFKAIGDFIKPLPGTPVIKPVADGTQIRHVLATPPDGRPLHNPDNLTAEQVGVGYRLPLKEESSDQPHEMWIPTENKWVPAIQGAFEFKRYHTTYRLPLSVPWPEAKPDPYAELKKAHAEGRVIQCITVEGDWVDCTIQNPPRWNVPVESYRIKPEPVFQLPPLPPPKETVLTGKGFTVRITYHEGEQQ